MDLLYSPICFSVDHLPSLHPHVSHTVPPPGAWPGPTTGIFGISHYRRPRAAALWRVWSEPMEIQEELGGSRAPEHLRGAAFSQSKRWEKKESQSASPSVRSDDGFHTDQLWCEDSWRYSVVEVLLKLQQLTHEVEVGGDDGPPGFDELVGVRHGHPGVLHQVGDHDGGWTRHACLAVDQKAHTSLMCFLCRDKHQIRTW